MIPVVIVNQDAKLAALDPQTVATALKRCVISVALMKPAIIVFLLLRKMEKVVVSVVWIRYTHVRARNVDHAMKIVLNVVHASLNALIVTLDTL
jgi:hypothetical protein